MIGRILSREGAKPQTMATFYKAIAQSTLISRSKSGALTKQMLQSLQRFHLRCAHHLTGWNIRQDKVTGEWIYPDSEMTLREAGL
jgi:hypothetical protein